MQQHLHIICFTVPYPVDYGGVYDLFHKLPALQEQGVQIHLHCFDYGRGEQQELNKYCASVEYYDRKEGWQNLLSTLPYIVATRRNDKLLNRLLQDNYPIVMEGIHSTYLLNDERFANRQKFVRLHNVEYNYYKHLQQAASSVFKKIYYWRERNILKKYEQKVADKATAIWCVTQKDAETYTFDLKCKHAHYLPLFLPAWKVNSLEGNGSFCLYQGDLSVDANEKAVLWLLKEVFDTLNIPFVIAGKNPSYKVMEAAKAYQEVCVLSNPSQEEMEDLIAKAHINILPSFSNTGIKLKLLNALYNGRHCVVNNDTVEGSGLELLCYIANEPQQMKQHISNLYQVPFDAETKRKREHVLSSMFNNSNNALQVIKDVFEQ